VYRYIWLDLNWYAATFNGLDVNPNSNGKLSPDAVVEQEEFVNSFLAAKPTVRGNRGGTVHTRNIKWYNNCVSACRTKEQEQLLTDRLKGLHLEIMQLSATENGNDKSSGNANDGSIASFPRVEAADGGSAA
jgi:hypothetical protein